MKTLNNQKQRDSNIELLRILTMLAVVILHINNSQMGGVITIVKDDKTMTAMVKFFESLCVCAVNVFVIISGYFLAKTYKRNLFKTIELLFQVVLISVLYYIISVLLGWTEFSWKLLIFNCVVKNWFVVLYVVLYIISPYINILIDRLNAKGYSLLLIILFAIFSIYPTIMDLVESKLNTDILGVSTIGMYGSQFGYTIVNFVLLYLIAGFIRKFDISIKKRFSSVGIIISCLIIFLWSYVNENTAWSYCNPFVIIEAVMCFMFFKNLNIGKSIIINTISKASFMVYLTHSCFLGFVKNQSFNNVFMLLAKILGVSIVIYLIGFAIFLIYSITTNWLTKRLARKQIFNFEPIKEENL